MRRTRLGIGIAVCLAAVGLVLVMRQERQLHERALCMGTVMGSSFQVPVGSGNGKKLFRTVRSAYAEVETVADLHRPDSELSRLNATAAVEPFKCSPLLWEMLTESRRAWRLSSGAFDISVKPLMDLWGFYRRRQLPPDPVEVEQCRRRCGLEKVRFDDDDHTVFFTVPGMALDLGGIAKGFALDLAARRLDELGESPDGILDLGGNLMLLGKRSYRIGIKDPARPEQLAEALELSGPLAVASSGDYERFVVLAGKKYGHIIDPRTGYPAERDWAATVWCRRGVDSDWLSTTLFLRGGQTDLLNGLRSELPEINFKIIRK